MKMIRLLALLSITIAFGAAGCSPKKDADIKTEIETNLKAAPDMSGVTVDVVGGIATIEGQISNNTAKAKCEKIAQEVPGVKTVINNLTVADQQPADTVAVPAPVVTPVTTEPAEEVPEDPLAKSVAEVTGKFPDVKAVVKSGVITLTGTIKKTELPGLMKSLRSLKPKKIEQKLNLRKTTPRKNLKPVKKSGRKKRRH